MLVELSRLPPVVGICTKKQMNPTQISGRQIQFTSCQVSSVKKTQPCETQQRI